MTTSNERSRRWRIATPIAAVAAAALALAACSSSGGSTTTPGGGSSDTGSAISAPKNVATGSTITFGFMQPDAGSDANPQIEPAQQAALSYINNNLGGINGHKVAFEICHSDESPAKSVSCANDFVQKKVVAVVDGFDRGSGSELPILSAAKIPVIGNVSQSTQGDTDTTGAYWALGPANAVYAIGPLQSFKSQGFKTVSFALADVPALHDYANKFLIPVAKKLGLSFKAIYYDPSNPNFPVLASTLGSGKPDVAGVVTLPNPGQCDQFVQAMRSAGFNGKILAGNCMNVVKDLGAAAKDVQIYANEWLPGMSKYISADANKELADTTAALDATKSTSIGYYTYETFALIINVAKIAQTVQGDLTSASLVSAIKGLKDFQTWIGPKITCQPYAWPSSSACSAGLVLGEGQSDGTLKPVGGGFITVSPSFLPG